LLSPLIALADVHLRGAQASTTGMLDLQGADDERAFAVSSQTATASPIAIGELVIADSALFCLPYVAKMSRDRSFRGANRSIVVKVLDVSITTK